MLNLAIVSPSTTNTPETFVQSHISGIRANVFFYYGDLIPRYLEGEGLFSMNSQSLNNKKAWLRIFKNLNVFKYKASGLGLKSYLFAQSLKAHHIDVVLAEYGTTSAEITDACKYVKIPLIAHFHGRDSSDYNVLKSYREKYQRMFDYASSVIAVSHEMEKRLMALGCPKDKLVYAPCVPEDSFFKEEALLTKPQFVFVGRFTEKKAPYAVLLAFKRVVDEYANAKLLMIGDGDLFNSTKNMAKILELSNNVEFLGTQNPDRIIETMKESLAYVQHSIITDEGDMEGTPVAVMEASAMGLPVISTFHAGIPDVVVDGETGLLCKELDVDKMASDMLRLLKDKDFAVKLGRNGKQRMKKYFTKKWQMDILTNVVKAAAKEE